MQVRLKEVGVGFDLKALCHGDPVEIEGIVQDVNEEVMVTLCHYAPGITLGGLTIRMSRHEAIRMAERLRDAADSAEFNFLVGRHKVGFPGKGEGR